MLAHAFQLAGSSSTAEEDTLFASVNVHLNVEQQDAKESSADMSPAHQVQALRASILCGHVHLELEC